MSRLLASLHKLLKLQDYTIEQLRQQISLVKKQTELRDQLIDKNIRHVNTERLIASVNISGSENFSAFVAWKHSENKIYAQEIIELNQTLDEFKEQLFESYRELKQLDTVRENEQRRINAELSRKESLASDEMATQKYLVPPFVE